MLTLYWIWIRRVADTLLSQWALWAWCPARHLGRRCNTNAFHKKWESGWNVSIAVNELFGPRIFLVMSGRRARHTTGCFPLVRMCVPESHLIGSGLLTAKGFVSWVYCFGATARFKVHFHLVILQFNTQENNFALHCFTSLRSVSATSSGRIGISPGWSIRIVHRLYAEHNYATYYRVIKGHFDKDICFRTPYCNVLN